jgi:hypothetical protein
VKAFTTHLEARGHKSDIIKETLLEAAEHIDHKNNNKKEQKPLTKDTNNLFIHWEYHSNDIDRRTIR